MKNIEDTFTEKCNTDFNFDIRYVKEESGGFSFYIPITEGYFSADSLKEGISRASVMIRAFIDFYREYNNGNIKTKKS